jgi:hypothetical protein
MSRDMMAMMMVMLSCVSGWCEQHHGRSSDHKSRQLHYDSSYSLHSVFLFSPANKNLAHNDEGEA